MPQNKVWRYVLGLLPLWILLVLAFAFPGSVDPITANPPALLGLPLGVVLVFVALAVMAVGIVALRQASSSRSTLIALLVLTVPAAVLIVVAPALILMVQNTAI
jgi:hypothetical protein